MDDYIMGVMWKKGRDKKLLMKYVIINTFDTITPQHTNCVPDKAAMEQWLKDAEYTSYEVWGEAGVRAKAIK